MKNLLYFPLLALTVALTNCNENSDSEPEPALPTYRYQLLEGNSSLDWFRPNGPGTADSLLFGVLGGNGLVTTFKPPIERQGVAVYFGEGRGTYFQPQPANEAGYINLITVRLSSKDTDTIRIERYPKGDSKIQRLRFLYNGVLCADYDLTDPQVYGPFYSQVGAGGQVVPLRKFSKT